MQDLDQLNVGMVYELLIENANDNAEDAYNTERVATQRDFDNF